MIFKSWLSTLKQRQRVAELSDAIPALEAWFRTPFGQALLEEEYRFLDEELSCLFGYHLMQLSVNRDLTLYQNSRICHCFGLNPLKSESDPAAGAQSDFEALPLPDESVDVTLLHHVLEFSTNPHQVLKEAGRVTIANGYVIILGFNPYSLMGVLKPFAQVLTRNAIWQRNSLRRSRVIDWLQFLDFSIQRKQSGFYNVPINHKAYLQRTKGINQKLQQYNLPFGNFYCLVARKDVNSMTLIRPKWDKEPMLPGVKLPKRSASARVGPRLSLIRPPAKRALMQKLKGKNSRALKHALPRKN